MSIAALSQTIIEFAIGNLAIALPLGVLAWWLQQRGRQPFLAHLVWLVVLVKLATPPVFSLHIGLASEPESAAAALPLNLAFATDASEPNASAEDPSWLATLDWQVVIAVLWLAGSVLALVWLLPRALRFNRLLRATSVPADRECEQLASRLAARLGLKRTPRVLVTAAAISPMVWWLGGPVRIYVPQPMLKALNRAELGDILAHELGHVGRGDHYVRWFECLVAITLWWNPVAWWARRNLRVCEEICCDAFVLARTDTSRDDYASALVSAMELLAAPTIRPSGMASHVNGGFIERRIRMILSGKTIIETPRWLRGLVVLAAAIVLPLGFTLAQDAGDDLEKARQWIESGVNSAFLTREQADVMLVALEISNQQQITLIDPNGNVVPFDNRVAVVRSRTSPEDIERALAFARSHFEAQVESGQMSQSEAQAIVEDIRNALDTGLAHGKAYYEQQFELGLIDQATAEQRLRAIQEMERAFNASPEGAALQSRSMPRAVVQAVPVDPSGQPANVARAAPVPIPVYRVERQPADGQ